MAQIKKIEYNLEDMAFKTVQKLSSYNAIKPMLHNEHPIFYKIIKNHNCDEIKTISDYKNAEISKLESDDFINSITKKFVDETKFQRFLETELYLDLENCKEEVEHAIKGYDLIETIESVFSIRSNMVFDLYVDPMTCYFEGLRGRGEHKKHSNDFYIYICPSFNTNPPNFSDIYSTETIAHEMSHAYASINLNLAKAIIKEECSDFSSIEKNISNLSCRNYKGWALVEEMIVRSIQPHFINTRLGINNLEIADDKIESYKYEGFEDIECYKNELSKSIKKELPIYPKIIDTINILYNQE